MYEIFVNARREIEKLLDEADFWIKKKSVYECSERMQKITPILLRLEKLACNDVQQKAVMRLNIDFRIREKCINDIYEKRETGKKQDGNIAFKCNWNDRHYKAPCSQEAYNYNLMEGRAWCRHPLSRCRTFPEEVTLNNHPCYESLALKDMYFGAGWDLSDDGIEFRHIMHARTGRLALLTTRLPGVPEEGRVIVGLFFIDKVIDDPGAETKIFGDKEKALEIDYEADKIHFWDYYKNPGSRRGQVLTYQFIAVPNKI
jgi:hypothetical protein